MLKDLQQRQSSQAAAEHAVAAVPVAATAVKHTSLIVVFTVLLTLAGVYLWQLAQSGSSEPANVLIEPVIKSVKTAPQPLTMPAVDSDTANTTNRAEITKIKEEVAVANTPKQEQVAQSVSLKSAQPVQLIQQTQSRQQTQVSQAESEQVNPQAPVSRSVTAQQQRLLPPSAPVVVSPVKPAATITVKSSSMNISRKQLTPEALIKQKNSRAKEALAANDIVTAEQLFEDILLIDPTNKNARKQLSALWFGRQSYQAAVNLLSQGIQLDPHDSELRLLQARIYIKQGRQSLAFDSLNTLPNVAQIESIDYQALLATQAQKVQQYQSAISAYLQLITQQAEVGRWWMGLAIAYDSNSQFALAGQAYHKALMLGGLSTSASKFIRQRIQVLGES